MVTLPVINYMGGSRTSTHRGIPTYTVYSSARFLRCLSAAWQWFAAESNHKCAACLHAGCHADRQVVSCMVSLSLAG